LDCPHNPHKKRKISPCPNDNLTLLSKPCSNNNLTLLPKPCSNNNSIILPGIVLHSPILVMANYNNNNSSRTPLIPHASLDSCCTFCNSDLSPIINSVQTIDELSKVVFICYYCRKYSHIGCIYNTLTIMKDLSKRKKMGQVCEIKCGCCDFRYRTLKKFDTKTKNYTHQQDNKQTMNGEVYKLIKSKELLFKNDTEKIYESMVDPILFSQNWFGV